MRFKPNDFVYYANIFSFHIELTLIIDNGDGNGIDVGGELGYMEYTGAFLADRHCFVELNQAREFLEEELFKFYLSRLNSIRTDIPLLRNDEEVGY